MDTTPTDIFTLSLHDALPILVRVVLVDGVVRVHQGDAQRAGDAPRPAVGGELALRMHHVRTPAQDLAEHAPAGGPPDPGTVADHHGRDRADKVDALFAPRAQPEERKPQA